MGACRICMIWDNGSFCGPVRLPNRFKSVSETLMIFIH